MDDMVKKGSSPPEASLSPDEIASLLEAARAGAEARDSARVLAACAPILAQDPHHEEAALLAAQFAGWDSKLYTLDADLAIEAAQRALELAAERQRYDLGSRIYVARKRQIALMIEASLMMPSHTSAKQVHATMELWLRLLQELPSLNRSLIEDEITLTANLCARSKMGIMPGDRLVYTAYQSFNHKESYDKTFRRALEPRLSEERAQSRQLTASIKAQVEKLQRRCQQALPASREALLAEHEQLKTARQELIAKRDLLVGLSSRSSHEQHLEELELKLAKLAPFRIMQRRTIQTRIAELRAKIAALDEELGPGLGSIDRLLEELELREAAVDEALGKLSD